MDPTRLSGPSRVPPPAKPRKLRTLASRLVLLGVLQLALLSGVAGLVWVAAGPQEEVHPHDILNRAEIARLEKLTADRAELRAALDLLRDEHIEASIYDSDRKLFVSNVEPALAIPERRFGPPGPPSFDEGAPRQPPPNDLRFDEPPPNAAGQRGDTRFGPGRSRRKPPPALVMHFSVGGKPGYLVARGVFGQPPGPWLPAIIVIASLAVLGVTGFLTARWIARPIDRLRRTARAIGGGDLTARSRLDRRDEIGELGEQIDDMAARLARLIAAERELLANVAHELRTPLSRIGVALDLAAEGDADSARAALGEISIDVSELETITDDIFMAMRFEVTGGAQLPLRKSDVSPATVAAAAADRFRMRHPDRALEVSIAQTLPELHVDSMLVRRVIDNLLDNAHKYTPDRSLPIELEVSRDESSVVFVVRDRGIGISEDDLPQVFTPFFRSDRSRSRASGGVGLGLTLAKRIIDTHGGGIMLAPRSGGGTVATVKLPVGSLRQISNA